jgi:hypothetical protein
MSSPREGESQSQRKDRGKSSGAIFIYEDPKTRELYHYARKGLYKKNGRTLTFVKKSKGETMTESEPTPRDVIKEADEIYRQAQSDEDAGYPPNCKPGYVEKDGKCVPANEDSAEWKKFEKKDDDEEKNGDDKSKDGDKKKKKKKKGG